MRQSGPEIPGQRRIGGWPAFWARILSPQTARFVLALLAIGMAQYTMMSLMGKEIRPSNRDALMLALGMILGLSKDAFGYYFGSTARGDERPQEVEVTNTPQNPAHVEQVDVSSTPPPVGPRPGDSE